MVKRRLAICLAVLLLLAMSTVALAAEYLSIEVTQSSVALPRIKLYTDIYDTNDEKVTREMDAADFEVMVDGVLVDVTSIQPFADSGEGIGYTFLIDISKSLTDEEFDGIKAMLTDWIGQMDNKDQVAIVTFGESVEVVQHFTDNKTDTISEVEALTLTDNSTRFYDGITKALDVTKVIDENLPDRRIIYTITDGQDDYVGGVTKEEVIDTIKDATIPVYALGVFTGNMTDAKEDGLNVLGEIVRASGGTYHQMGAEAYDDILADVQSDIDACYILTLNYDDFEPDGTYHDVYVSFEQDGSKIEDTVQVLMNNKMKDYTAPFVSNVLVDEANTVTISFSEEVIGADVINSYRIEYIANEDDDEDEVVLDQVLVPVDVVYDAEAMTAVLSFEDLQDGAYSLFITGINDASDEANVLESYSGQVSFVVEQAVEAEPEPTFMETYGLYVYIGGSILLLLVIVLIIASSRKKGKATKADEDVATPEALEPVVSSDIPKTVNLTQHEQNHQPVEKKPTIMLHFAVVDYNNEEHVMEKMISDQLIIGRSSDCDLSFDDDEMSRQHCKIVFEDGILAVEDLNATNTTIVNGVPIYERKRLDNDDMLLIGQTEMRVTFFLG